MKKALRRSLAVILIVALSVGLGYLGAFVWDGIERKSYPLEYSEFVDGASEDFGVPRRIIYATIKVESNFNASAKSSAGAIGLMQITPATFEEISGKLGDHYEQGMMFDPETNIRYGAYYLSYLYKYFGDWELVYAAYNAGMGNVSEWLSDSECVDENGKLVRIPYQETKNYVKKIKDAELKYSELYPQMIK